MLKTLIQHEPVYEGFMFMTNIEVNIKTKWNNKKGYFYILDDINRSIFGKEQTDYIYSTWFGMLSPSELCLAKKIQSI